MANQQQETDDQDLDRPLKDGERVLAPTRRPDGTLRKPIRIRAGYTPQDEVAIYKSKGALLRKEGPDVPPGYDPVDDVASKPKTKSAKKNQKRKEKKHQVEATSSEANGQAVDTSVDHPEDSGSQAGCQVEVVAQQIGSMSISNDAAVKTDEKESEKVNLEKRIRALRKKIRSTESLLVSKGPVNPEQAEKLSKLDSWQKELNDLESQRGML